MGASLKRSYSMVEKGQCSVCGGELELVRQTRQVFRPDPETMTDGQLAEQRAAQMGGAFEEGIHGVTTRVYVCKECGTRMEV